MPNAIIDNFGKNVFNDKIMKERLSKDVYNKLRKTIDEGETLDLGIANEVAKAMKEWAVEKGATHYTHWFQPMTGVTAEKHDSFISPTADGQIILEFSGKELIKGEPDASSFPSGGLRATFEARGYTAWDCTSPAFIKETVAGNTLCIPTIFCSYTGEALDKKTPLLRSTAALNKQTMRALKMFGNEDVTHVNISVGPEQEYFLVNKDKYMAREDLVFTGRTLFGAPAPKSQEVEGHYYGAIKEDVQAFMNEVNIELWKLGVLAKTQHNEAAPAQYEIAPVYSKVNIATDHNQLTMETLKRVARHYNMECLLHEKPFKGVNGSGKHNNWSIITNTGVNLLNPGKTPHENIQFLFFLTAVIKAVDENASLLRVAASGPGNDHRLGAHEAPPAIISIYLGEQLSDIVDQIINTGNAVSSKKGAVLESGVAYIPSFRKDATDRNRTSPFAFTGNKFEFRMVGSSISIACTNVMLNTMVADALKDMTDELEDSKNFDERVKEVIKENLRKHSRIIFNGNNYTKEWYDEAKRRGLPCDNSFAESIKALTDEKTVALMARHSVFTKQELESRAEIQYDIYVKTIDIEAKTMVEMASKLYIPAVIKYIRKLAKSIIGVQTVSANIDVSVEKELLTKTSNLLAEAKKALELLKERITTSTTKKPGIEKAMYLLEFVFPVMEELRHPIDELEQIVDIEIWPVPGYSELMF